MDIHDLPPYKEIAPRLIGLREAIGFSQEELAAKLRVETSLVVDYESATMEIPVSYLMEVARVCGVDLTSILSGSPARLNSYTVVRSGHGLSVQRRKDYDYWNLASNFSGRRMEPFLVRVPPKKPEQLSFTSHKGQEFIYMLEGRLELHLDNKVEILEAGDSIYFSSRIPHALRGLDGKDALFVDVLN
jgi:quercetin dioxygenase-like cupin family protein